MDLYNDKMNSYLFHYGINYTVYNYLGCHFANTVCSFRVWAPNAENVFLVGDFCGWRQGLPMECIDEEGVWEVTLPAESVSAGDKYKFKIYGNGQVHYKADPYAFYSENFPDTASIVYDIAAPYCWKDGGWLQYRKSYVPKLRKRPMNIYELDIGSWKYNDDGTPYSYTKLATELAPYVKQMGFTHIEIVSVAESDCSGSSQYQTYAYFSPASRFGTPEDFKAFVDVMHEAGIGVILDWGLPPVSMAEHALNSFDGQALYEDKATGRFLVRSNEVASFLISNAVYWIKEYHADGLKVSNIDSIINSEILNIKNEIIGFLRKLTSHIKTEFPDVLMIADDSSLYPKVTGFNNNGLGFDLKWDCDWREDLLRYAEEDPLFRKHHHEKVTYSLTYAFSESHILPLSHECVSNGRRSFLDIMSGDYWQKFAATRAFWGYLMTHPGKKLNFMGTEIGQFRNWNNKRDLDWFLLEYESHAKLQLYISDLNHFYLSSTPLWKNDDKNESFKWIDPNNRNQSIVSYRRIDSRGNELIVLINFTPVVYENYRIGVPTKGSYVEVFNSDDERYGGSGVLNSGVIDSEKSTCNYLADSIEIRVPPLGMTVFKCKQKKK